MKLFSAGLTLVNFATIAGLLLGMLAGGLDSGFAGLALIAGIVAAIFAAIGTESYSPRRLKVTVPAAAEKLSKRARRRLGLPEETATPSRRSWPVWTWAVGFVFALFALRSFCWLLYIEGAKLRIQSPNNLGDLALHLTYIKYFANGVALWPDNPIYVFSKLRYPAGIDLFNSVLLLAHIDLIRGLVWVGLLASAATFYGFYRWGGGFAVAGFLFNGGITGYRFFQTWQFQDYQGEGIAWKSIPLTMFVTQRGLLYAIPAGLLLLLHWRRKFFPNESKTDAATSVRRGLLPWWVEFSLYATMPLFHVHTFLALSIVLGCWLLFGSATVRWRVLLLLAASFLPATGIIWLITDHFQAKSILAWAPGWLESDPSFSSSPFAFWIVNFGLLLPAALALAGVVAWRAWRWKRGLCSLGAAPAFVGPAVLIFFFAFFVKTAPWGWDNTKLFIWAYFICLPFLWRELIARWSWPIRYGICLLLFLSGFVTLIGGLALGSPGYDIADRADLAAIGQVVRRLPIEERFAAFPTFNHPLLLDGRKVVLGYPGHLWTQGFDQYAVVEQQLKTLMLGAPDWRARARALHARYLFWGEEEKRAYGSSTQPWRGQAAIVGSGPWGTIYDLESKVPRLGQ